MAEDRERHKPAADYVRRQDEGEDVEGHALRPEGEEDKVAATEEPPDVEAHKLIPKHKP